MFDDQPINNNQAPSNLPIGEPEDIFANTEEDTPVSNMGGQKNVPSAPVGPPPSLQTAVGVGKIQPKMQPESVSETKITNPPFGEDIFAKKPKMQVMPAGVIGENKIKGPGLAKNLMIFLIVVVGISILAGGSWLIYSLFVKEPAPEAPTFMDQTLDANEQINDNSNSILFDENTAVSDTQTSVEENITETDVGDIGGAIQDEGVLFGEPVDSDADNLSDNIELEIGLDPNNWDTDGDGLSDGDEVLVWKSNPLKMDTDGDTYSDGAEVKNGYSPIGPGRIFDLSNQ